MWIKQHGQGRLGNRRKQRLMFGTLSAYNMFKRSTVLAVTFDRLVRDPIVWYSLLKYVL